MPSLYDISVPVFIRGFKNLSANLTKAEQHAKDNGIEPETYVEARLIHDMLYVHNSPYARRVLT